MSTGAGVSVDQWSCRSMEAVANDREKGENEFDLPTGSCAL